MKTLFTCTLIAGFNFSILAAQFVYPIGARSGSLGNASTTISDVWSNFNNQAGLGFVKNITAGANYENRFLLKELSLKSVAVALPFKGTTFGLSASSFGFNLYSENKYGFAVAKAFGEKISAGVQIDYLKTQIVEGYSSKGIMTVEMGILVKPFKNMTIGAHLFNPVRSKINDYNNERISTILKVGASYMFSEKVLLLLELSKNNTELVQFRAGLEYLIVKELYIRAGMGTNPANVSFGVGLNLKQIKIDLSTSYHQVLGYTPQIGIVYSAKHD